MLNAAFNFLYNVSRVLPQVQGPQRLLSSKEKLKWTLLVLFAYFLLYNTTALGIRESLGLADVFQVLTASRQGSLMALGIGPIVIAGIFIQLFSGGGLLNLDPHNPETRKKILGAQITLAIIIAVVEAVIFTLGYANNGQFAIPPTTLTIVLVALQLIFGAIAVIYMDQIVTKYGIGSGIGLFIAAGVSFGIMMGAGFTIFGEGGIVQTVAEGGIEGLSTAFIQFLPFISTIVVFWFVVYGESAKVRIPLSIPGSNRPLELPFFYVSNLPVIFAAALLINILLISRGLTSAPIGPDGPGIGHYIGGILYMITPIHAGLNIPQYINFLSNGITPVLGLPEWLHAITYIISLALLSVYFGKFWVEMSPQQNPEEIAKLLSQQNIAIRGHRTDKRFLEKKLSQYIWPLTTAGSLGVGLLAGIADLLGAYGTGTGILLTVSIILRMTSEIKQTLDVHYPSFSRLVFGE